jgi:hypothetical protein
MRSLPAGDARREPPVVRLAQYQLQATQKAEASRNFEIKI